MMIAKLASTALTPVMAMLLAATDVVSETTGPFGTLGAFGLLSWYVWYDVRHARPHAAKTLAACEARRQEEHDASLEVLRQLADGIKSLSCSQSQKTNGG